MKKAIVLMTIFFFFSGCASTTVINSKPPGAKIYLNGQEKGETPYTHTDKSAAWARRSIILKKEGYQDLNGEIKHTKLSVPALVGGILVGVPFIWILEYPPQYTFQLEKLK